MKNIPINFKVLIISVLGTAGLFFVTLYRAHIDTDITRYLPQKDPVISDAGYVFRNHPIQDRLIIDIGLERADPDALASCSEEVEQRLKESGLFKEVGTEHFQDLMPDLMAHILDHLPAMFTERELNEQVGPILDPVSIRKRLEDIRSDLLHLNGIGQARFFSTDPLGLKNLVLARLSHLAPVRNIEIYKGKILSPDGKHLLLVTRPDGSGTDTAFAKRLTDLFEAVQNEIKPVALTPVGAYRAALDNEIIARKDVQRAIILVTAGISLLLFIAFPRPLLGLFAFLPATAGTVAAFFVFAILHPSVSIMVIGFGAAVISITVDHAIAFLLFLDQPYATTGKGAAREIRAVGLLATLTTIGAFGALCFSGFPLFAQIGQFTALGLLFSFIFVHTVFPAIFPSMPPVRPRPIVLRPVLRGFFSTGKVGALAALLFGGVMLFFARPHFNVNLDAMNTVSEQTAAAEKLAIDVWGSDIFRKTYLLMEGHSLSDIQDKGDRLLEAMAPDMAQGVIASGFVPSMIFPGRKRVEQNLKAWINFWNPGRIRAVKEAFSVAPQMGFSDDAFASFFHMLQTGTSKAESTDIPHKFLDILGIVKTGDGSKWTDLSSLTPGRAYDAETFYRTYASFGYIFDPAYFSIRMGRLLFFAFTKMLILVGLSVIVLVIFFFLNWKLTLISLLPIFFALVSTVGTLNLMGHPLDIPGLMLAIVVMGMGIDYTLFTVTAYQRYGDDTLPSFDLVRMTIFMASSTTIIGFGTLAFAEHSMLKSAGLTSLLGISYALMGAVLILPPILRKMFQSEPKRRKALEKAPDRILMRYRKMEPYYLLFARFKLMLDPMFSDLPRFFDESQGLRTIIDIGTGYGVPACWLLERFQATTVYGIDSDPERVRVAVRATGERGVIRCKNAPDVPAPPVPADAAVILDVIHFLDDDNLALTLKRLRENLKTGGMLVVRAVMAPEREASWMWRLEVIKRRLSRSRAYFRSAERLQEMITHAGFACRVETALRPHAESAWFIGKAE